MVADTIDPKTKCMIAIMKHAARAGKHYNAAVVPNFVNQHTTNTFKSKNAAAVPI
jgi:hypothetical protein